MHVKAVIMRSSIYKRVVRYSGLYKLYLPLSSSLLRAQAERSREALTPVMVPGDGSIPYLLYVLLSFWSKCLSATHTDKISARISSLSAHVSSLGYSEAHG